jgi:cold shock protein
VAVGRADLPRATAALTKTPPAFAQRRVGQQTGAHEARAVPTSNLIDSSDPIKHNKGAYTMTGTIKRIVGDRDFGFITGGDGMIQDYFFHRDDAPEWERLREGQAVTFEPMAAPKGPRATLVYLLSVAPTA